MVRSGLPLAVTVATALLVGAAAAPPATQSAVRRSEAQGRIAPRVKEFVDRQESGRRGAIAAIEHELRGLRQQPAAQAQAQIRKLERDLADLRAGRHTPVPALHFAPLLGQIGRLPERGVHVEQILDGERMLVRATFPVAIVTARGGMPRDERTHQQQWFLIRGLATDNFDAGADVPLGQTLWVSGRWHYTTDDGRRQSVLVLEPYEPGPPHPSPLPPGEG